MWSSWLLSCRLASLIRRTLRATMLDGLQDWPRFESIALKCALKQSAGRLAFARPGQQADSRASRRSLNRILHRAIEKIEVFSGVFAGFCGGLLDTWHWGSG